MNKTIKIILIILVFIVLSIILHFNPVENFRDKLSLLDSLYQGTVLTITSKRGNLDITIEGEDYGRTPTSIENLDPGQYLIELEKDTESEDLYEKETFLVNLYPNTESIISLEIAPRGFKSGHILYYTSSTSNLEKEGELSINTNVNESQIYIDEQSVRGKTHHLESGEYEVDIRAKGYESIEFPIIIREGYNLNADVYLLPIPISFD